jgi:hypothetical protein
MPNSFGFSQDALLERAAGCDRALEIVINPEIRAALKQLREVWVELAEESPAVLREEFADEILLLSRLQAEIAAAGLQ